MGGERSPRSEITSWLDTLRRKNTVFCSKARVFGIKSPVCVSDLFRCRTARSSCWSLEAVLRMGNKDACFSCLHGTGKGNPLPLDGCMGIPTATIVTSMVDNNNWNPALLRFIVFHRETPDSTALAFVRTLSLYGKKALRLLSTSYMPLFIINDVPLFLFHAEAGNKRRQKKSMG